MTTKETNALQRLDENKSAWAAEQEARLRELSKQILAAAIKKGADGAQLSASIHSGQSVSVRCGEVETIEYSRDRGISLTVYMNQRKGAASTADLSDESVSATVDMACDIARYTEQDDCAGLADADRLATSFPELDLWHPAALSAEQAIDVALEMESAAFETDAAITNSEGANVNTSEAVVVFANSDDFLQARLSTRQSMSAMVMASDEAGKQRDYWYDSKRCLSDLQQAQQIGTQAARRALDRLGARPVRTQTARVLFDPAMARSLISHLVSAASGSSLYRNASFLRDRQGQRLFPEFVSIHEQPLLKRGLGSTAYDLEGVATTSDPLIESGVLSRYLLGSYSARRLGLASTGNSGGTWNLTVSGQHSFSEMLEQLGTGLYVTELMGQGVSVITGDYSRGASGFWVENGTIVHPVEGVTIAGNLLEMYRNIVAIGDDDDQRSAMRCGSILVDSMMVAGE